MPLTFGSIEENSALPKMGAGAEYLGYQGLGAQVAAQVTLANQMIALPFAVPNRITITSIVIYVLALGVAIRGGIYANENGEPTTLIAGNASGAIPATNRVGLPLSVTLNPGWYWLAVAAAGNCVSEASAATAWTVGDTGSTTLTTRYPRSNNVANPVNPMPSDFRPYTLVTPASGRGPAIYLTT